MDAFFEALGSTVKELVPAALIFAALAVILKRDKVLAALMAARREIGTNLGLMLFNTLVLVPLVAVPVAAFRRLMPRTDVLLEFWQGLPGILAVLAAIMLIDFAAYWRHRFEHSPALWRIHATHHADEAMNWRSSGEESVKRLSRS